MKQETFKGRIEDARFLTGRGRYVDDITLPRQSYMALVLSPHAHAVVKGIDASAAMDMPGVLAVLTGRDVLADGLGSVPPFFMPKLWGGPDGYGTLRPILVTDKVRCVGDRVAIVVAETRDIARIAADAVAVDYEPLAAVTDARAALSDDAPRLWDDCPTGNLSVKLSMGNPALTADAFAKADRVIARRLKSPRVAPSSLEPRGCIGSYDWAEDRYTLYTSSQDPHGFRKVIAGQVLKIAETRLRVISPDVGGGFGLKAHMHPEDALVLWASKRVDRPVKWIATRSEALLTDTQGRGQEVDAEIAVSAEGRVLGLRATAWHNLGAYFWGTATPPLYFSMQLAPNIYDIPAVDLTTHAVFTNIAPMSVYRGAGRPEATYLIERMMDEAAAELHMDPVSIRKINAIRPEAMPYATATGMTYDSGRFGDMIDQARAAADWEGYPKRVAASRERGRLRGRSLISYVEVAGVMNERMELRFEPDGTLTIIAGTHSHGQGHATTFSEMVSQWLSIPVDDIRYVQGDTDKVLIGRGTFAARSSMLGGTALLKAKDQLVGKAKAMAALVLEGQAENIEFEDGLLKLHGTNKSIPLREVAKLHYLPAGPVMAFGLGLAGEGTSAGKPGAAPNYPNGCQVCELEIDPDSGEVILDRMIAFDDVGRILNAMLCEGQIHGGIAQGIGQALLEEVAYDAEGQLTSGSLMDYCLPRAEHMPSIVSRLIEVPCTTNPLGVKGIGESGAIGTPVSIVNAIVDALRPLGIDNIDMPVTQPRLWAAIRQAQAKEEAYP
ncbi:xanthine dehydrogenase family protein molybdopterin-binding subunit [Mesorhizobium sp. L-8-3]|uniref:xanthine dehydrogenase family protein molybdopterin-binding subunit n=1 Tax=Mesorhizobium sp. L-8-3 TaxID=2744522 RepID=UPI0019256610|nr:xanthine dehydrogenase family protein molybdopterin-binding subunit [Mesorhizobium sp. L-8-3]BCH21491.1 carbon-monoxide dehydrogenase large subunit [Mesorhizobium sp. L-8-3]